MSWGARQVWLSIFAGGVCPETRRRIDTVCVQGSQI